ncbi:MAG: OmpA family protein [Pseudomonadota bacterium]
MKNALITASLIALMSTGANAQLLGGGGLGGLPSAGSVGGTLNSTTRTTSRATTTGPAVTRTVTQTTTTQAVDANGANIGSTVTNQANSTASGPDAPLATAPIGAVGGASGNFAADTATRSVTTGVAGSVNGSAETLNAAGQLGAGGTVRAPDASVAAPTVAAPAVTAPTIAAPNTAVVVPGSAFVSTGPVLGNVGVRRTAVIGAGIAPIQRSQVVTYIDTQYRTIQQDLAGTGAIVEKRGEQIVVSMPAEVTFAFDKSDIRPRFYRPLNALSASLQNFPATYVDVIGHTDSKGTDDYNLALSQRRASSVAGYLSARSVSRSRISTEGRGEFEPVDTNATTQGRAANRRVEIILTPVTT